MQTQNPNFSTTQWTVVLQAIQADPEQAAAGLERLCQRYWYPVYAFVRQRGHAAHEAEDLVQGFFHYLLARQAFQHVNPEKGRFRSFLLAALTNFLHNEHDKHQTHKRGGQYQIVSLDQEFAEAAYALESQNDGVTPSLFERHWALMLVRRVFGELQREYETRSKGALFASLQPFLTGEPVATDYDRLAQQLGMEAGTVKVALHRARRRFGELLRHEVAHTVDRPEDVEVELRLLLAALAE